MINEGGKWAHVVLRKCVFEPKAAGISSLMHQPSTGHLRSTVCCAVSSVPAERRCIDCPKTPSHSLTFFLFLFFSPLLLLSFLFFIFTLHVLPCLLCISFTPPLFHLITPFLPLGSLICLAPLSLPPFTTTPAASLGLLTLHNSISVFCVCFFCLCVI